jgi:pimeloyl-ACP methyl ester carboxylesterase
MAKHTRKDGSMNKELVILLHGILRSKFDMLPMSRYLRFKGYDTINILYPSREMSLEDLTEFVHTKIISNSFYVPGKRINFVAHSMGGLITRYYIAQKRPSNLGHVVMLGTPNTGSEFADFLNNHKFLSKTYKTMFGPAGQQLITGYPHIDKTIDYPLGVIAGSRSINPLAPFVLPGAHDGIVPVERTKIEGMKDHIVLPSTHSLMMFNPRVIKQVHAFLKNAAFDHTNDKKKSSPTRAARG